VEHRGKVGVGHGEGERGTLIRTFLMGHAAQDDPIVAPLPPDHDVGRHVGPSVRQTILGLGKAAHDDHFAAEHRVGDLEEERGAHMMHREEALIRAGRRGNHRAILRDLCPGGTGSGQGEENNGSAHGGPDGVTENGHGVLLGGTIVL